MRSCLEYRKSWCKIGFQEVNHSPMAAGPIYPSESNAIRCERGAERTLGRRAGVGLVYELHRSRAFIIALLVVSALMTAVRLFAFDFF